MSPGDGTAQLALILLVSARPQGGLAVGGLLLASGLPRLLGPVAGALADRLERRRMMVVCDLLQALLYLLMAALLPAYAACLGSWRSPPRWRRPMGRPSHSAVSALVVKEELSSANALLGLAVNVRVLLAPVVGASLVTTIGVRAGLLANVASFVLSVLRVLSRIGEFSG